MNFVSYMTHLGRRVIRCFVILSSAHVRNTLIKITRYNVTIVELLIYTANRLKVLVGYTIFSNVTRLENKSRNKSEEFQLFERNTHICHYETFFVRGVVFYLNFIILFVL